MFPKLTADFVEIQISRLLVSPMQAWVSTTLVQTFEKSDWL